MSDDFPFTARDVAGALNGDVVGRNSANVPGPGHRRKDRSLTVTIADGRPAGFWFAAGAGTTSSMPRTTSDLRWV